MNRGIIIRGGNTAPPGLRKSGMVIERGAERPTPAWLLWKKTIVIKPEASIRADLLEAGLSLLDSWDLVLPLDIEHLALEDVKAKEADRDRARKTLGDLRLPAPYTGWLFLNREGAARDVIEAWAENGIEQEQLAFMTAVYQVKPRIMLVPTEWIKPVRPGKRRHSRQSR